MKNLIIALGLVVATSSSAFAVNSFGDGSPANNANVYETTAPMMGTQKASNNHFGYTDTNKAYIAKNHTQNNVTAHSSEMHFGDGSPANQQN